MLLGERVCSVLADREVCSAKSEVCDGTKHVFNKAATITQKGDIS